MTPEPQIYGFYAGIFYRREARRFFAEERGDLFEVSCGDAEDAEAKPN